MPSEQKRFTMPGLAHFLVTTTVGNYVSLALAAAVGAAFALAVGLPLMRLSGLAAGIATFAVLGITYNVLTYEQKIGPGQNAFSGVPQTTGIWQAAIGGLICATAAYVYQRTRFGRMLRATREDPAAATAAGISIYRQRLLAFTLSGALAGLRRRDLRPPAAAAGERPVPRSHLHHARDARRRRRREPARRRRRRAGAERHLLVLPAATNTVDVFGWHLKVPAGTAEIVLGVLMAVVLILRPNGITGGREFSLPRRRRPVADLEKARATT